MAGVATEQEKIDFAVIAGKEGHTAGADLLHRMTRDPSEEVRYYAIRALILDSLDRGAAAANRCWELFENDPSGRVRSMAVACLGSLLFYSMDRHAFEKIKARVSAAEDRFESESALEALYSICGRPPLEWPSVRRNMERRFGAIPPEIDVQVEEAISLEKYLLRDADIE